MRRALLLAVLTGLMLVPLARADGDPASDYLLGQQTFVPPDAGVSSADAKKLTALLTAAKQNGYTIRVALIASRYDMGAVTALYKRPLLYAHFLSQELRFLYKGRVLVVMPNGYAIARNGKPDRAEQTALDPLPLPAGKGAPLAAAASRAVRALAADAGVSVVALPAVSAKSSGGSATRDRIVIAALAAVLLLALFGLTLRRRR